MYIMARRGGVDPSISNLVQWVSLNDKMKILLRLQVTRIAEDRSLLSLQNFDRGLTV